MKSKYEYGKWVQYYVNKESKNMETMYIYGKYVPQIRKAEKYEKLVNITR